MREVPGRRLWIGNAYDLRDTRSIFDSGIEAIVELADNEPFVSLPRELVRLRFPLSDNGANPRWLLRLAINTVAELITANVLTLVCCSNGLNRSVCLASAALAQSDKKPLNEVLGAVVSAGPADVSPRLLAHVQAVLCSESD